MKLFSSLSFIIFFILTIFVSCQKETLEVKTDYQEKYYTNSAKTTIEFIVKISPDCTEKYKYIKIESNPATNKALLYFSIKESYPRSTAFDISATNSKNNLIYVPRTYFEKGQNDFFYMNSACEGSCNFTISFQLVEMMHVEKSVRFDFLTFDYEEYLIYFERNTNDPKSQLMITASGGAKGHHGSRNNVKLELLYVDKQNGSSVEISVNSDIMFNGAGTTFLEQPYQQMGEGYYLAKVRGPTNTYINFMVRQFNAVSDLPIDGKAIYGFLQGDDLDKFKLTGFNTDDSTKDNDNRIIQVSVLAKGDLVISKSSNPLCDRKIEETTVYNIKDELQALLTFTSEEILKNIIHICIQGENIRTRLNAFIIEVHDVTDQKRQTIVTEPLVNGFIYTDQLKLDEVRSYRHSKYLSASLTKYNCKLNEGRIEVALVRCPSFPLCYLTKDIVEGRSPHQTITSTILTSIDNYYTTNVDIDLETNAYAPVQYLLAVVCLTEKCTFEVSFSDEEDSLVLREDSRIAHYISPNSTNYYRFKITQFDEAQKVFVYLRTISGNTNIDVIDDATERKRYYIENTKILEFYEYEYTGLYTLNVTGNVGSFYLLSYSILRKNETEENKIFDIGLGISFIDGIKSGHKNKKLKMLVDKTRGNVLHYLATFYSINCNIGVKYNSTEDVKSINGIFQHEIEVNTSTFENNYLEYQVNVISFNDDSSYDNKFCLFHITAQEVSSNTESIISEGTNIGFALTPKTNEIGFIYPHSAGQSDILIKYNLENSYLVRMLIKINTVQQKELLFSRSSSHVIPASDLKTYCGDENQVCGINIHFKSDETSTDLTIPMSFIIKSKDNTPSSLVKNKLQVDLVAENSIQYYLVEINPDDKGEVVLNFKKGSGLMFAKMVGKDAEPEENADWNNRVRLPKPDEKEESVGEFDRYKNNIKYDATKLFKYGLPVCQNGCELYIGVISTDVLKTDKEQNDYLEYSIYVRPEINTNSSDADKHQELINKAMVDLLANEYVTGYIESSLDVHYYFFDVQDDCDFIEVEFQSESCTLYINHGNKYPDPGKAEWELNSKISSTIFTISREDLKLDNLKDVEFRMAVNSKKYDELMSMMYIFRIRVIKRSSKSVIEINGNLATACEIDKSNDFCDLLYPLSDYEFNIQSSLFIYAEPEVISDIDIYFNSIISYQFDRLTKEEMEEKLPRPGKAKKSTENQEIKNYIELTPTDLQDIEHLKSYALISIRSNKPGIINIYTTMRQQVSNTTLNPYSKLLFQRKQNDIIYFKTKGDQAYNFYITCINGEAEAYFESEENSKNTNEKSRKIISGSGSQFSLALPERKEDTLIIKPTSNLGIIFYINENIHPEVRQMELIKFGFSGRIVYDEKNLVDFPLVYYMKIQDEDESINFNMHINNLKTSFDPSDMLNYTDILDIYGYIVDESMITSMMRSKRINPPQEEAVRGRYDKSLSTAKLYFTPDQIKSKGVENNKYLVITLDKNEHMDSNIESMNMHISAMPFSNKLYSSPYNLYIAGNLLKNNSAPLCNYHRLRVGNQGDKYMQIELGILSKKVSYEIKDMNNNEIKYKETMKSQYGKYKGIIELQNNNDLYLEFCRDNISIAYESSLNYLFKVKSKINSDFTNYILNSDKVEYKCNTAESGTSLDLKIPKVLNKEKTQAIPATYYIRLYPNSTYDSNNNIKTITFISYYAYATYIYKISGNDEDKKIDQINIKIDKFPEDQPYIVSIIAVTSDEENEEIFAYEPIVNPYVKVEKEEPKGSNTLTIVLIIVIVIIVIALGVAGYFIIRLLMKRKNIDDELSKIISVNPKESDNENLL